MKRTVWVMALLCVCGWVPSLFASAIFINEIHYDNSGSDVGEAIEVAGPAGTDLSGWSLALYNGSNGSTYGNRTLTGVIPDLNHGYGVLSFEVAPLQNGSADGIALVDAVSNVMQFLSYEGAIMALSGVAAGFGSSDIGVFETSSTPAGSSLQLVGMGSRYDDFTWALSGESSFGRINHDQRFQASAAEVATVAEPSVLWLMLVGLLAAGGICTPRSSCRAKPAVLG